MIVLFLLLSSFLFASEPQARDGIEKSADFRTVLPLNVNPITGEYCEGEVDLVVAGVEPLSFRRFYSHFADGDPLYGQWKANPESKILFSSCNAYIGEYVGRGEPDGGFYRYNPCKRNIWRLAGTKSFTNSGLTGASHPANTIVETKQVRTTSDDPNYTFLGEIRSGDGRVCRFASEHKCWPALTSDAIRLSYQVLTAPPFDAKITEEILPSGNILKYEYIKCGSSGKEPSRFVLESITAFNREGKVKIGELKVSFHNRRGKEFLCMPEQLQVTGSDERKVTYNMEIRTVIERNKTRGHPLYFDVLLSSVDAPGKALQQYSYPWKQKKGEKWEQKKAYYNKYAILERTTTRDGLPITIQYEGGDSRRVRSLSAPVGPHGQECVIASYDYKTGKTIVTDAIGNQTIYHFDNNQRMTGIETADLIQKNHWGKEGDLLRQEFCDKKGHLLAFTAFEYDQQHNPIKEITKDHTIYRQFDDKNRLIEERDGERRTTYKYEYSLVTEECVYDGNELISSTKKSYDDAACLVKTVINDGLCGREISIVPKRSLPNFGLPETVVERDLEGNLIKKVVYSYTAAGKVASEKHYDADNKERYTIINCYDERERLISTSDALGQITTFTYDANNNLTSETRAGHTKRIKYDKANRPVELIDGDLVIKRSYNNAGQLIAETDPSGFTTQYRYDSANRLISTIYPDGSTVNQSYDPIGNITSQTDCLGYTTKTSYNDRGQPLLINYPDGSSESFTYDGSGRKKSHTDKNGRTSSYVYNALDQVIEIHDGESRCFRKYVGSYLISESDQEGYITTYSYNSQGQKIAEEKAGRVIRYGYDALGRCTHTIQGDRVYITTFDLLNRPISKQTLANQKVVSAVEYRYDEAGNRVAITNSRGSELTTYNSHHQPIVVRDVMGNETRYGYKNGLLAFETNPNGMTTHKEYDCCNRATKIYCTNPSGETIQCLEKDYDGNGNCTKEIHHVYENTRYLKKITHTFVYGPGNRLEMLIEAGLKKTSKSYDDRGRLQSTLYPNRDRHCYEYDKVGRLVRYYGPDFDYEYSYDKRNNLIAVRDKNFETKRVYSAHNEMIEERLANGAILLSSYNDCGQRIKLTLPDLTSIDFTYRGDDLDTVSRGGFKHRYERDGDGAIIGYDLPGKLGKVTIKRDDLLRPTEIKGPGTAFVYTYDRNGNLLSENERCYKYDDLDHLIAEGEQEYSYDSMHNRLDCELNDLCQLKTYDYDENGNLLLKGFVYDSQGRLIESPGVTYSYDSFHRRLSKSVEGVTTYYLWDGENEIGSFTTQINELRVLGEGLGGEIGGAVLVELEGRRYIPIHDHRGSVRRVISLSGGVRELEYDGYGRGKHGSVWTFCSKRYDSETGLVYFGRRYYVPGLGRWLTPDPIGFSDGPNLYAYVHSNPMSGIDEHGLLTNPLNAVVGFCQVGRSLLYPVFKGVELAGKHLIPIGGVRDVVEAIGRWGAGGSLFGEAAYRTNHNNIVLVPGKRVEGMEKVYVNGMHTSFKEAYQHAKKISEAYGGIEVVLLYNGSHGVVMDLIECGMAKLGITTPVERMCVDYFTSRLAEDAGLKFDVTVHSQGASHLMNVAKKVGVGVTSHMDVSAFGPATLIPRTGFNTSRNFVSKMDVVPRTNPFKYARASTRRGNTEFLSPRTWNPLTEHALLGDTYSDVINQLGKRFMSKYL